MAASAIIVVTVAAATASAGLIFFNDVATGIQNFHHPPRLPKPDPGEPYTMLLLGSDHRSGWAADDRRSDTTMLLRLDPQRNVISLLSLPRDLAVNIPGYGVDKLNAAYTYGGPTLTLQTVKQLTGLQINDVIDVDFQGFADAVNAIDCVYVDVDQKYYVPPGSGYAEIDINAGYQRLCGLKALEYVRYRHTDNDIVRGARQQAFLREARQRVDVGQLVLGGGGSDLLKAFVDNTRSTIDGGGEVRSIARSLFDLRGASVEQVSVSGDLGPVDITATQGEIDRAVSKFLTGGTGEGTSSTSGSGGGSQKHGKDSKKKGAAHGPKKVDMPPSDPQFARYARTADRRLNFPVYYPTKLPGETTFSADSRTYGYKDEQDDPKNAYKLVMAHPDPSIVTEYFGVEGTSWGDPPILANPSTTATIDGREYLLFYAGDRLRLVGFKEDGNAYWVSNSLLNSLSENEMMTIATSLEPAPKKPVPKYG